MSKCPYPALKDNHFITLAEFYFTKIKLPGWERLESGEEILGRTKDAIFWKHGFCLTLMKGAQELHRAQGHCDKRHKQHAIKPHKQQTS